MTAGLVGLLFAAAWFVHKPQSPSDLFDSAVVALDAGDSREAERLLRALHRREGFERHCELLHGGLALRSGRLNEALRSFSRVLPEGDLKRPALMWTGEALYGTDQLAVSLSCFTQILEDAPDDEAAIRWAAAIKFDLGAMNDALRHLEHLVELNPNDFAAHRLMGTIYFDFEKWQEAGESLQNAYRSSVGNTIHQKVGCEFARALLKQRKYDQAQNICNELNEDESVLTTKAECAWVSGDREFALDLLERAAKLVPDNHKANLLAGRIHIERGQPQLAVPHLETAIKAKPFDFDAHYHLTIAFRQLKQQELAQKQFAKQESIREFRVRMAELNQQAIENPQDKQVRLELARLCHDIGHTKLARIWEKAARGCIPAEP